MLFKKVFLREIEDNPDVEVVQEEILDTTRWSIIYERIFKYKEKYYKTTFSVGATECQPERAYDDDPNEVECPEVFPVQTMITTYVTTNPNPNRDCIGVL